MHLNMFSVVQQLSANASIQPSMDTTVLGLEVGAWASTILMVVKFEEVDLAVGYDVTELLRC